MAAGVFFNGKTEIATCSKTGAAVPYEFLILGGALRSAVQLADGTSRKIVYRSEAAKQAAIQRERDMIARIETTRAEFYGNATASLKRA